MFDDNLVGKLSHDNNRVLAAVLTTCHNKKFSNFRKFSGQQTRVHANLWNHFFYTKPSKQTHARSQQ